MKNTRRGWFATALGAIAAVATRPKRKRETIVVTCDPFAHDGARRRQDEAAVIVRKSLGGYN